MVASKVTSFKTKGGKTVVVTLQDLGLDASKVSLSERRELTMNLRRDIEDSDGLKNKFAKKSLERQSGKGGVDTQKEIPFAIRQRDGGYMRPTNPEMLPDNIFVGSASGEKFFLDKTGEEYAVVHYKTGSLIAAGRGRQTTINKASSIIARNEERGMPITSLVKGKGVNPLDVPDGFPLPSSSQPKKTKLSSSRTRKNTSSGAAREMKKIINQASVPGLPPQVRYEKLKQAKDYAQQNKMEFPANAQKQLTKASREVMGMN